MARKRKGAGVIEMPAGVHSVKSKGKTYHYWHPGRGTPRAKPPIPLGSDHRDPAFWNKLAEASGGAPAPNQIIRGSWAALDREYRGDEKAGLEPSLEWRSLAEGTRAIYALRLKLVVEKWGNLQVSKTSPEGVQALRRHAKTPSVANQIVSVIGAAMKWGRANGYPCGKPTHAVDKMATPEADSAEPWPEWAYAVVMAEAPQHLRRAAFLGRATGQRRSDLVRLGRSNRRDDGLEFKIKKLRNKVHVMPLRVSILSEIDSWKMPEIGPYITTADGRPTTGEKLADDLKSFCQAHPRLKNAEVFMHGLRALAVCDRRMAGLSHQEISAQIRMSLDMVIRYSRKIDGLLLSREANKRWEQTGA